VWRFFFPKTSLPECVKLVADKDMWRWRYGSKTAYFFEGMRLRGCRPDAVVWQSLLNGDTVLLSKILKAGAVCVKYSRAICEEYVGRFAFSGTFEGHSFIAVGLHLFGSETFGKKADDCDMCMTFEFDGQRWTVSLFSQKINVMEIAQKYGGGGHRGATGFVTDRLPFSADIGRCRKSPFDSGSRPDR
jgi:uncharacterized protein